MPDVKLGIKIGASLAAGFKSVFQQTKREINEVDIATKQLDSSTKKLDASVKRAGNRLVSAYRAQSERARGNNGGGLGSAAAFTGAAFTFAQPIRQAIEFETALLGVAKQVDGARDATGKLTPVYTEMRKEIQLLGRQIPIATNDLAAMVEAGARMGIARDQLIGFTTQVAQLAAAFDGLDPAQLADDFGRIATLYKIPIPAIGGLADTINFLDDSTISKGGDIIGFLTRVGGVAASVKITAQQTAALGSTLLTLGETTETAGTAANAIFQKFASAESGTKSFKEAMASLGLSLKDVQKGFQVDAQGSLLTVLDKVNALPADQRIGVLADLVGLEHSDTLAKLASGVSEYRKQIALAGSEKAQGSVSREFSARLGTTSAQLQTLSNRAVEIGVNFGSIFLPALNSTLQPLASVASWSADVVAKWPVIGQIVGVIAAAVAGYAIYVGSAAAAQWVWNAALSANPIGLVIAGIAAFGALAYTVYKNWEPIMAWFRENFAWLGKAVEFVKGAASSVTNFIGNAFNQSANASQRPPGAVNRPGATPGPSGSFALSTVQPRQAPANLNNFSSGGKTVNMTTNAPITIVQQPGQNSQDLAGKIQGELTKRQAADQRRALHD
ncbi:MAG: phage tail tape measure protein [Methylomonas sp.]|nr:MAG: phage tail tape measure protein [Methylobacter sp.]PPD36009.1 MAG: phage tail tape measure protein [Methylomonas sp.]